MVTVITIAHVVFCISLMLVVLLQAGQGGDLGATFGGSSQSLFGARGAATFLSKVTTFCAVGFMVTSLSLTYARSHQANSSIMDGEPGVKPAVTATPSAAATPNETLSPKETPAATPVAKPQAKKAKK